MLFKRKKKEEPELTQPSFEFVDVPMVIKRSVIKPTTCKFCRCTYQARHKDLVGRCEGYSMLPKPSAKCPVCETMNFIVFEEDENETSL